MGRDADGMPGDDAEGVEAAAAATEARLERRREQIDLTPDEEDDAPSE